MAATSSSKKTLDLSNSASKQSRTHFRSGGGSSLGGLGGRAATAGGGLGGGLSGLGGQGDLGGFNV